MDLEDEAGVSSFFAHHHMTAHAPIQIYANSHMIAEPSAQNQELVPMSTVVVSGNETANSFDMTAGHAQTIPTH